MLAVDTLKNDTLLSLERLKVELRLWKLLKKEIEVEEISVQNAVVDSFIRPSITPLQNLCAYMRR